MIAPHVRHVHLKDYRVQFTDEGFRLVRCAIGDGAVPFKEMLAILGEHHETLPAVLEPGALEARHVRLFTPDWWKGYAPKRPKRSPPACWRRGGTGCPTTRTTARRGSATTTRRSIDYELDMIRRSAANMRALGIM